MEIHVSANPVCPVCGSDNVRAFKVHTGGNGGWSSHCISCDNWFDELNRVEVDLRFIDCGVSMRPIDWIKRAPVSGNAKFDRLRRLVRRK